MAAGPPDREIRHVSCSSTTVEPERSCERGAARGTAHASPNVSAPRQWRRVERGGGIELSAYNRRCQGFVPIPDGRYESC